MSSPWTKIQQPEVTSLQDIMCEQIAKIKDKKSANSLDEASVDFKVEDTTNDAVLALMLQKQYDDMLKTSENELSGTPKDFISCSDYSRSESCGMDSELEDKFVDILDKKHWDQIDQLEKCTLKPKCGNKKQEDCNRIIKHSDENGFNQKLLNNKLNKILSLIKGPTTTMDRYKEDDATEQMSMNQFTGLILYKLINKQLLERIDIIISTSKKAIIFHAKSDPSYAKCVLPQECAVKVFKTELKQRDKFIKDDHRFKDRHGKFISRKLVQFWAEKEMLYLNRLKKIGVPCPEVVALKHHVLVTSFIGSNHKPAPKLKYAKLKPEEWILAYEQVCEGMRKMYNDANLIHVDLSENNILWHEGKCWFVGVSQAVEPTYPENYSSLLQTCTNIAAFFKKQGVPEVQDPQDLFLYVRGYNYWDRRHSFTTPRKLKRK